MARIAIIDDEQHYCRHLELFLSEAGHEVRTAFDGCEAIRMASRFRPDVLIIDWMLRDHIHGLHVARTVRAVAPYMQIILITGFPSPELKREAQGVQVFTVIEKPFTADAILQAVEAALASDSPRPQGFPVAVMQVDGEGRILYANPRARSLLAETSAGVDAACLSDVFSTGQMRDLAVAADRWVAIHPGSSETPLWRVRSQPYQAGEDRFVVIRRYDDPHYENLRLVELLLNVKEPGSEHWPFRDRVIVIDPDELYRRLVLSMLETSGASCCGFASVNDAIGVMTHDPLFVVVVMDRDAKDMDVGQAVMQIRAVRPEAKIVGTSEQDRRAEFESAGISRFLCKPWCVRDLIPLLRH